MLSFEVPSPDAFVAVFNLEVAAFAHWVLPPCLVTASVRPSLRYPFRSPPFWGRRRLGFLHVRPRWPAWFKAGAVLLHWYTRRQLCVQVTSQSARAPVMELEGQAGVTNVSHGLDVDAMPRQPAVTFGEMTTIEVT
jgi:hypothetical protein